MSTNKPAPWTLFGAGALCVASIGWAYWPTILALVDKWETVPDYSHGWLVLPIALIILWVRRGSFPSEALKPSAWGFVLLGSGFLVRYLGVIYYLDPLVYFSVIVTCAGFCLLLTGWRVLYWALPGILFLAFLFPMPFGVERSFSFTLQGVATTASCWLLQFVGEPAYASGHVIHIREQTLDVVQACSGLRMLVGFLALCVAYAFICERKMWERILIVLAAVPVAILCNILRITATGLLNNWFDSEVAHKITHDWAGFMMMPVGLAMLMAGLWYLDHLFVEVRVSDSALRRR